MVWNRGLEGHSSAAAVLQCYVWPTRAVLVFIITELALILHASPTRDMRHTTAATTHQAYVFPQNVHETDSLTPEAKTPVQSVYSGNNRDTSCCQGCVARKAI